MSFTSLVWYIHHLACPPSLTQMPLCAQASVSQSANPQAHFQTASPAHCLPQMLHMSPHIAAFDSGLKSGGMSQHTAAGAASAAASHDLLLSTAGAQQPKGMSHTELASSTVVHTSMQGLQTTVQPTATADAASGQHADILKGQLQKQNVQPAAQQDSQQRAVKPQQRARRMTRSSACASLASSSDSECSWQRSRSQVSGQQQHSKGRTQLLVIPETADAHPEQQSPNAATCSAPAHSHAAVLATANRRKIAIPVAVQQTVAAGQQAGPSAAERDSLSDTQQQAHGGAKIGANYAGNMSLNDQFTAHAASGAAAQGTLSISAQRTWQDAVQQTQQQRTQHTSTQRAQHDGSQATQFTGPQQVCIESHQAECSSSSVAPAGNASADDAAQSARHRYTDAASLPQPKPKGKRGRSKRPPKPKQSDSCSAENAVPAGSAAHPGRPAIHVESAVPANSDAEPALHCQHSISLAADAERGIDSMADSKVGVAGCADNTASGATLQVRQLS